jgi:hypothetical protein
MKSYMAFMSTVMTLICLYIFLFEPTFNSFTFLVFGVYFCVGFVDTMAEGMTALITKMEAELTDLKKEAGMLENTGENESDKNKKAIGNYLMFKMFVKTLGIFTGGILANKVRIGVIYAILGVFPVILLLWTLFLFKEDKVSV